MNIYNKCLVLLGVFLITACASDNEIDPVFDENTQSRVLNRLSELNTLLVSSEFGWVADYVPDDNSGVYKMHIVFNEDNTADFTSDHNFGNTDAKTSYRVGIAQIPELVFENYSTFANITDNFDGRTSVDFSRDAEFQFNFTEQATETEIVLESKSDIEVVSDEGEVLAKKTELILRKASATDKETITSLRGNDVILLDNYVPNESTELLPFKGLVIQDAAGDIKLSTAYSYNPLFRNVSFAYEDNTETEIEEVLGVELTDNGFKLFNPFEFEGESFSDFVYDASTNTFNAVSGDSKATITGGDLPFFIGKDVFDIRTEGFTQALYRPSLGTNSFISDNFTSLINKLDVEFAPVNQQFFQISIDLFPTADIGTDIERNTRIGFVFFDSAGERVNYFYFLNSTIEDRKIKFDFVTAATQESFDNQPIFQDLIDFFTADGGLIYNNRGAFSTTTNSFSNQAATFLNTDDPSLGVYFVWL